MTSTPISNAARLLRECAEEIKSTCTAAGEWCSEATDDKADYEERIAAANLLEAMPSKCLHQIQEPPTKTEALAHYSQQAILAMGEAGESAVEVPDEAQIKALMRKHRIWIEHSTLFEDDEPPRELRAVQAEQHQFEAFVQDLIALATTAQATQQIQGGEHV
mgnify:CR=1 FL=1